jgi:hypothetical protein
MVPSTLVFVGVHPALSPNARGVLQRCGFVLVEYETFDQVLSLLTHGWEPTFVVVEVRRAVGDSGEPSADGLPAFVASIALESTTTKVVAICQSEAIEADLHRRQIPGLLIVRNRYVQYRRLARTLIDLYGGDGAHCCPSAAERQSAT